jgi:hypothetical protein
MGTWTIFTPAIILNSSPERWMELPVPDDAILILPGLALAWAMNSGTVLAGNEGFTSMIFGAVSRLATGAMSRMKLKLSLS